MSMTDVQIRKQAAALEWLLFRAREREQKKP